MKNTILEVIKLCYSYKIHFDFTYLVAIIIIIQMLYRYFCDLIE